MTTVKIPHTVELVTELDTKHPMALRLLALPPDTMQTLLQSIFISLVKEQGFFDLINKGNSYATLKFAQDCEDN